MKKIQLKRLEEAAFRFLLKPEVKEPEAKPREFLHGFSVLPERYTGKVVLNLLYGYHDRIPEESKIQNDKHQLYVSVTHLFDFSRYEILNKKKPRIAFLLRPYDKSFPYPRGANKYRTVELDRRSGVISGCNNYLTFEISPDTLLKRCLFIRVKAYKGKVPSAFLGQIKIDFSHYKRAEDVVIVDKEAYLYGKFYEVGTLDIEMYYKLQHGCLTVTLHSANILPSHEDPGDTLVRIYHEYMGDLVDRMQTEVQAETFTPVYNETFDLKMPRGMIEESVIHFKLMSRPPLTIASDFAIGEVFLAQRTNCDGWKNLFVNSLVTTNPKPVRATVPIMYYH
ncbi:uncharacterized protein LOC142340030 [Convolutriloba macropyga]|uniref:uncharacterized protein LOC142340030 n=1 Tax=Convolutriloba macropyga TaxID=536237 RepID=UPI003F52331B